MLDQAAQVPPADAQVVVVADWSAGSPVLLNQSAAHGWDRLAPVRGQTRWQDRSDGIYPSTQVSWRGARWNGAGRVVNNAGWQAASIVAL